MPAKPRRASPAKSRRAKAGRKARPKSGVPAARTTRRPAIHPMLWFDAQAEQAAEFYASVFPGSRILAVQRYGDAGPGPKGQAMVVDMTLAGQRFSLLNGGPQFSFNESVSFVIDCKDQAEVDHYWSRLTADGGQESMCGWLKDRFGVSWQVTPRQLLAALSHKDPRKAERAMRAMLTMRKIDVAAIQAAVAGR